MTEPTVSASVVVRAPAERVYAMVSDVPRMPEWAAECARCVWLDGVTGPRIGARFRGQNRSGWHRWSTTATVVAAEPGSRFAFRVTSLGLPVADWAYDIAPAAHGCIVTESMWYRAGFLLRQVLAPIGTGTRSREERIATNVRNIALTLEQLRAAAEAPRDPDRPPTSQR